MRGYFQKLGLLTKSIVLIRFKVFKSDIESMHAVLLNYVFVKCFAEQIEVGLNSFCAVLCVVLCTYCTRQFGAD